MGLEGKKVAILLADDYEDLEMWYPYYRMKEAEAEVHVIGSVLSADRLKGRRGYMADIQFRTDISDPSQYDAIIVPGGWSSDRLSWCTVTLDFIKRAYEQNKIIASISHGVWVLFSAGILKDKNVTSAVGIRENIKIGGANWTDTDVVRDGNIITSRSTSDLPSFCREIMKALSE